MGSSSRRWFRYVPVLVLIVSISNGATRPYNELNDQFLRAVSANDIEKARQLLDQKADANAQNLNGVPALTIAIGLGNLDMITLLLDRHADVNLKDDFGLSTPLIAACKQERTDFVKLLLANKADVHASGDAALLAAARIGNEPIMNMLIVATACDYVKPKTGTAPAS